MKTRQLALLGILIAAAVLLPISCDLLGSVSIGDRIALFQSDLNTADRSAIYLNFHPDLTTHYNAIKGDPTIFDNTFEYVYAPYTITITDQSDPANVIAVIDADDPVWAGGPLDIWFKMAQKDKDWMIEEIVLEAYAGKLVD